VKSFESRKTNLLTGSSSMSSKNIMSVNNSDDYLDNPTRNINGATGVFIWKLHTGKLERNDISLMEEYAFYSNVGIYPVTLC